MSSYKETLSGWTNGGDPLFLGLNSVKLLDEQHMSSYKEILYDWMGANEVLFLSINSIRNPYYDEFMRAVSWVGDHDRFPIYCGVLFAFYLASLLVKSIRKIPGKWYYTTSWMGIFLMLGLGYGATGLVSGTLKEHFSYPRPYIALAATGEVRKLEATTPEEDFRSFPSGHVAFTTFMVVALSPLLSGLMTWCGALLIVLMAWSRMALGMHFPADVIASILIMFPLIALLRWLLYSLLRKWFGLRC